MSDFWVFGYGSLIWQPGFPYEEAVRAELTGFHRALCIFSTLYRGSSASPGLVFGLDAGGFCNGMAFRVAPANVARTIAYLREREQVTGVYRAEMRLVRLEGIGGQRVRALTFVANRQHRQYARRLALSKQVEIVRAGHGVSGANADYVRTTAQHLRALEIRDRSMERMVVLLGRGGGCEARPQPYRRRLVPRLPTPQALRCGYMRNLVL